MVIRLGRCMTRRRFIGLAMQELVSAVPPMVATINAGMSGAGVSSYMTSGAGGERTRSSCSAKNILCLNACDGCQVQAVN